MPWLAFAVVHFNLMMYVRRRNRLINKRLAKAARIEGMREPRRLVAMERLLDDLTPDKGLWSRGLLFYEEN